MRAIRSAMKEVSFIQIYFISMMLSFDEQEGQGSWCLATFNPREIRFSLRRIFFIKVGAFLTENTKQVSCGELGKPTIYLKFL